MPPFNYDQVNDWRLTDQAKYLYKKILYWQNYQAYSETWEHDHCEFCWAKFTEENQSEDLHAGYTTQNQYYWICETCFNDFCNLLQWQVSADEST